MKKFSKLKNVVYHLFITGVLSWRRYSYKSAFFCIVFLLPLSVLPAMIGAVCFWLHHTQTFTYEKSRPWGTPKEIEYISSSTRLHEHAAEMKMDEIYFLKMAKKEGWAIKTINKPFKIIRYNFLQQYYDKQVLKGRLEDERQNSCYHYIINGYYYVSESNNYFVHVGYDLDNHLCYVYYYRGGKGPLSQEEMYPDFN